MSDNGGWREGGWQDQAACVESWADLPWTSNGRDDAGSGQVFWSDDEAEMASICAGCPVRRQCRELAEELDAAGGFWAGRWRTGKGLWAETPAEAAARLQAVLTFPSAGSVGAGDDLSEVA